MHWFHREEQHPVHHPHRPPQVNAAVYILTLYLVLAALLVVAGALGEWFVSRRQVSILTYAPLLLITAVAFAAMMFVVREIAIGRNWARFLLVAGLAILLFLNADQIRLIFLAGDLLTGMLALAQVMVTILAVALLFSPPSNEWFRGEWTNPHHE